MLEILVAAIAIGADQLTKWIVETHMRLWESINVIGGILSFTYVKNTGAGFSFLNGYPDLVEWIVAFVVLALVIFSVWWKEKSHFFELSTGLIIGGALSNMLSRLINGGAVTDFIRLPYWPVFNVADSCVVAGAVGLGIYFLKREEKCGKN